MVSKKMQYKYLLLRYGFQNNAIVENIKKLSNKVRCILDRTRLFEIQIQLICDIKISLDQT